MGELKQINLKELSIKWRNKKDMYDLLATDADVYMPPIKFVNIYYVRGIVKRDVKVMYFYAKWLD